MFIVSSDANKEVTEQRVAEIMSEETGDGEWRDSKQYKSLILEHHMAASRFGFLELYLPLNEVERVDNILSSPAADESIRITALRKALSVPFTTLEKYFAYVSDNTRFATHQGVKGLEFPRVMVIIDDAEAKGFLFSYEKLFGVKLKTETDIKNEREGKDNSITRTTRLFYVACTRAQKSLAIIAYTYDCEAVKATAMKNNWFEDDEIRLLE